MPGILQYWKINYGKNGQIIDLIMEHAYPACLKSWKKDLEDVQFKSADEIFPGALEHYHPYVEKMKKSSIISLY